LKGKKDSSPVIPSDDFGIKLGSNVTRTKYVRDQPGQTETVEGDKREEKTTNESVSWADTASA
jgi:hypothetical protein